MRAPLPGFDPFQHNGWIPFAGGGIEAVTKEAPMLLYVAPPELATALADKFQEDDLQPGDLRFGVWPDAFPQPQREPEEAPGVHLNVFGGRQASIEEATLPEIRALDALTRATKRHVAQMMGPLAVGGVTVQEFDNQAPTMHRHVIARERRLDGLDWAQRRPQIDLARRRAVAERVSFDKIRGRRPRLEAQLTMVLRECLVSTLRFHPEAF